MGNMFDVFGDIPERKKDPNIQTLYEYEKHYMELIKRYQGEIEFIENMLKDYRKEQVEFFADQMPMISAKLDEEAIDKNVKTEWLNHLTENMNRSFAISEKVITNYTTKKLDEFKTAVNEKLRDL